MSACTTFWDMHSGGGQKLDWSMIYIEAPREEAELVFQNRFDRNPNRVSCTCCGPDYSIQQHSSVEEAKKSHSSYERGPSLVVWAADIKEEERQGELRDEGYVWREP